MHIRVWRFLLLSTWLSVLPGNLCVGTAKDVVTDDLVVNVHTFPIQAWKVSGMTRNVCVGVGKEREWMSKAEGFCSSEVNAWNVALLPAAAIILLLLEAKISNRCTGSFSTRLTTPLSLYRWTWLSLLMLFITGFVAMIKFLEPGPSLMDRCVESVHCTCRC